MRRIKWIIFSLMLSLALLLGCDNEPNKPSGDSGYMIVHLTDAPAFFDAVNITFSDISFHLDSVWVKIRKKPITVNLLDWTDGKTMVLGEGEIPAGHYTQLRLLIESGEVVIQNQTYPLPIPSGVLKFGPEFTVEPGSTYELVLDFDVNRSIVRMGSRKSPRGFMLKPHIRVIPRAISGSISGIVVNPEDVPVAYAIQGADTVNSASVDTGSGAFILPFLPEGSYTVAIKDTAGKAFSRSDVAVVAGQNSNLGTVTLQ